MVYLCILFTTILIASQTDLMINNITETSHIPEFHYIVIFYTILTSFYFAYKIDHIFKDILHINNKSIHFLIIVSSLMIAIGSIFPYTLNQYDISSQIHVLFSFLPCLVFLGLLFVIIYKLSIYDLDRYFKIIPFFRFGIIFLMICLILFSRVNGYLEILFVLFVSISLYMIENNGIFHKKD